MPEITERNDVVTQITTVKVPSKNQSEVICEAIETLARAEARSAELSPYEAVEDLIGSVRGGDPNLSRDTGRRFTEMLLAEKKRRESE